jgi:autotransporter-associated beta strand protein
LVGQNSVANRGIYNLSGGSITIGLSTSNSRGVMLGVNTGASGGTFNLSGTGVLNMTAASGGTGNATLQVGRFDSAANNTTNEFNQTGGTANIGVLSIGGNGTIGTGITSAVTLTGGSFSANQFARMAAGNTNSAIMTIGGSAVVTLPAFPTARGTSSTATLQFDGGTLKPTATAISPAYISGLTNAFIRSGGARFDTAGFDITVSQALLTDTVSTGGGLTKDGSGTLNLTATNTYTGNTSVTAGTLSLGNGTTNTGLDNGADVIVAGGATLNLNYSGTDTIDELTINGVPKSPGIWGSPASGAPKTDPQLSGAGTLTVTTGPAASDYDLWAGPGGFNLSGGPGDDDDGDGKTNFSEYAFGLIPTSAASLNPMASPLDRATGQFQYTRRATPATTGVSYTYRSSTTLTGTWPAFTPVAVTSNNASPVEVITVTMPAELLQGPRLFIQIEASKP